jgi:hypothetical protein
MAALSGFCRNEPATMLRVAHDGRAPSDAGSNRDMQGSVISVCGADFREYCRSECVRNPFGRRMRRSAGRNSSVLLQAARPPHITQPAAIINVRAQYRSCHILEQI